MVRPTWWWVGYLGFGYDQFLVTAWEAVSASLCGRALLVRTHTHPVFHHRHVHIVDAFLGGIVALAKSFYSCASCGVELLWELSLVASGHFRQANGLPLGFLHSGFTFSHDDMLTTWRLVWTLVCWRHLIPAAARGFSGLLAAE